MRTLYVNSALIYAMPAQKNVKSMNMTIAASVLKLVVPARKNA